MWVMGVERLLSSDEDNLARGREILEATRAELAAEPPAPRFADIHPAVQTELRDRCGYPAYALMNAGIEASLGRIQERGFRNVTYEDVLLAWDEVTASVEANEGPSRLSLFVCVSELNQIVEAWPNF